LIVDLSTRVGFPLLLDTDVPDVITGGDVRFVRETRRVENMRGVLYEPDALPLDSPLYWNYKLDQASSYSDLFHKMHLTFGLVLLPPMKVGVEYVKTHGHYHSSISSSNIGYPEVYTHYYGELYLYMQRRSNGSTMELDDCVIYEMIPGQSIMVPPGYAHILINTSQEPALMAGLYSLDAIHDYQPILETAGGAYFLINETGRDRFVPNRRYSKIPPLREVDDLCETRFSPPNHDQPLWNSFVSSPECYSFINDPDKTALQFHAEDLTL